jgi:DNA-binding IscR family transcriptional regulator
MEGREHGYVPARDLEAIALLEIHRAVRCEPGQGDLKQAVEQSLSPGVRSALEEAERGSAEAEERISLRALADLDDRERHRPRRPAQDRREDRRVEVFDAKQPGPG